MLKGGSASDLLNPSNIMGDTMLALQKPSSLLINPMKDKGKTATAQQEEDDEVAAQKKNRETNKWLNWTLAVPVAFQCRRLLWVRFLKVKRLLQLSLPCW